MKQFKVFILTVACLVTMSACSARPAESKGQADSQAVSSALAPFVSTDKWPEDDFTKQIPKPDFGTVNSVSSTKEYTCVQLADSSIAEVEAYVELLEKEGFHEISRIKEKISTGATEYSGAVVLKRDDLYVNITYLDHSFSMMIH